MSEKTMDESFIKYERIAPVYDFLDAVYEFTWRRQRRKPLFHELSGRILDAGIGTGRNIPFYPKNAQVVGIDPSPGMLKGASKRAKRMNIPLELHEASLTALPFPDQSFDAVVSTFVFCVLPDEIQLPALKEVYRVLKPGGVLRILDYSMSEKTGLRAYMRVVSVWLKLVFAARYSRTTNNYIEQAGLELISDRFVLGDMVKMTELRRPV